MKSNSVEEDSRSFAESRSYRLTYWVAGLELMLTFFLADIAVISLSAGLITVDQLLASALAYVLIASGTLVTVYEMSYSRPLALIPAPSNREPLRSENQRQEKRGGFEVIKTVPAVRLNRAVARECEERPMLVIDGD